MLLTELNRMMHLVRARKSSIGLLLILVLQITLMISVTPQALGSTSWRNRLDGLVDHVDISADGSYTVAETSNRTIFLFDGNGTLLWTYPLSISIKSVVISADGTRIVAGVDQFWSGKPDIYLFDKLGNVVWQKDLAEGTPCAVAISPDAKYIAIGDTHNTVFLYDIDGNLKWKFNTGSWIYSVSTSADGEYTATGGYTGKTFCFFNKTGNLLWNYTMDLSISVSVSPNGQYVAAGSAYQEEVYLFNQDGTIALQTETSTWGVDAVSVSDNADKIAMATHDKVVVVDKAANKLCEIEKTYEIRDVAITADGKFIAFACRYDLYFDEPLPPSEITLKVWPAMVFLGESVTVSGYVTPQVGEAEVTLEYKLYLKDSVYKEEGFFKVTKTVNTIADGSYADLFYPNDAGKWVLLVCWSGDAFHSASEARFGFMVDVAEEISLLSDTGATLYCHRERYNCVETFPSTPPEYVEHYHLNLTASTLSESKMIGFNPGAYIWLGHPHWGYFGFHTGPVSEETLIQEGVWNLSMWASAEEPNQHFFVNLCYWKENHEVEFIASWDTGYFNTTSPDEPILLAYSFDLPATIVPKGKCLGFVIAVGRDSNINLFFDSTVHSSSLSIPPSIKAVLYGLRLSRTEGGYIVPYTGTHYFVSGTVVNVTATPLRGYSFDHWELDGTNIGSASPTYVLIDDNHTLYAVFVDNIPPQVSKLTQDPSNNVQPNQNVTVTATVTDLGSGVNNVTLWYSTDNGTEWIPLNMVNTAWNSYQTIILGCEEGTWIRYNITAYDKAGNRQTSDNEGNSCIYYVIPEFPAFTGILLILSFITVILLRKKRPSGKQMGVPDPNIRRALTALVNCSKERARGSHGVKHYCLSQFVIDRVKTPCFSTLL